MKILMIFEKRFIFILMMMMTLVACDDDPIEPEVEVEEEIDLNDYHISFKLDGDPISLVPNGIDVGDFITRSGGINVFDDPETEGEIECGGGFETTTDYLELSYKWAFVTGEYADNYDAAISADLAAGTYGGQSGDGLGFGLEYSKEGSGAYRSQTGDQTGSTFAISEVVIVSEHVAGDITIKGSFNCKLYDESLVAHSVTEGSYYVRFESQ